MPLLGAEAALLSEDDRQKGIIEEMVKNDEFFHLLPFVKTEGLSYLYTREKFNAGGEWFSEYEDLEESTSTVENVSVQLKRIAGQADIDNFIIQTKEDWYDQVAIQLRGKAKRMGEQFRSEVVNGDVSVNPKGFDGIRKLTAADQTLSMGTNGGAITFSALDELVDSVRQQDGKFLMMRQEVWRQIRALNRAMGGNTAETIMVENFGQPIRAYDGVPVLINEFIPVNEIQGTNEKTSSVYCLRANEADGLHGLYGGNGSVGFNMSKLGTNFNKDSTRFRVVWYSALALKARTSLSRLKGVTIAA